MLRLLSIALSIFFLAPSLSHSAEGLVFSFDQNLEGWQVYGEGKGAHATGMGHQAPGSLFIEAGSRTHVTAFNTFKNLAPGRYLVEGWVRGREILAGEWNQSVWIFYDAGKGHKTVVKDLKGSFEWSRLRFTVDVEASSFTLWIRLKAAGSFWIDDLTLTPTTGRAIAYDFTKSKTPFPTANSVGEGIRCPKCYRWADAKTSHCPFCGTELHSQSKKVSKKSASPPVRMLMNFEKRDQAIENQRHSLRSFNKRNATSGKRSAIIKYATYNYLQMKNPYLSDWSGYDYLAIDVFNPLDKHVRFDMTIKDTIGGGYWNQLNHNERIAPGWNRLKIHINRFVGERGSVRIQRYLNTRKLIAFWFGVGLEQEEAYKEKFLVDNIRLLKSPPSPASFDGLRIFDFVKEDFRAQEGFTAILDRHRYDDQVGFGLTQADVWQSHDSLYADNLNRDGIFLNRGGFAIDLPNGPYEVRLNINHLGLWNKHFWAHRKVMIEGKEVFSESRKRGLRDYVRDFTRFQEIEPGPEDDAYSLYLDKVFAPILREVQVSDGQLNIEVEGDRSGICLNWLAVYPSERKAEAEAFFQQLKLLQKEQFDSRLRKLEPAGDDPKDFATKQQMKTGFYSALIAGDTFVRHNQFSQPVAETIELSGGRLQRPAQTLLVRSLGQGGLLSVRTEDLTSDTGEKIVVTPQTVRYTVNQYQCHTFNNETYELAPRFYRDFPPAGISLPNDTSKMLRYQVKIGRATKPGFYTGKLAMKFRDTIVTYPIRLTVYPFTLPPADIAVGFFGLNPFHLDYVKTPGLDTFNWRVNRKVLKSLSERGFTTWSSLPEAKLVKKGRSVVIESPHLDQLMAAARRLGFKKVFTYGGGFDVVRTEATGQISGMPAEEFCRAAGDAINEKIASSWLPIVYNYSDEASGYSQKVERDLLRAEVLKKYYPLLERGGFSHPIRKGEHGYDLNQTFTVGSYSSMTREAADAITGAKNRWGLYNQAIGNLRYNREVFGQALFTARNAGADHFLEWYLNGSQNYPYYDLDGRENDAMMLFPRADGRFDFSIKLEWAAEGVEDYRLLQLLESRAEKAGNKGKRARKWLAKNYSPTDFFAADGKLLKITPRHGLRGRAFRAVVYQMLLELREQ